MLSQVTYSEFQLKNVLGMEYSPIISVLSKLWQKDHKFATSLGNRLSLKA